MDDPSIKNPEEINQRKEVLERIAGSLETIERQDSLQRIAGMPEEERRDFVKQLVKQIRKKQGLKDEKISAPLTTGSSFPTNTPNALFTNNESKGEWYFYNTTSKQKGAADFKVKWGNRPNTDNWRRGASISAMQDKIAQQKALDKPAVVKGDPAQDLAVSSEITFDGLYNNLPLTKEQLQKSNDSIQGALFKLGIAYIQGIEDCGAGTATLEDLRTRFPAFSPMEEVLFNLYYCYNKNGEAAKAAAIKKLMEDKYSSSNLTTIVTTGKNPGSKSGNSDATKAYEKIYDLFIEGNFPEAIAQKKIADSLYSNNSWSPQLLYIEAVYYIKQREDSTAINVLNNIITQFGNTPLAERATNLIGVLGRRSQIEDELNKLVISRPVDTITTAPVTNNNNLPTQRTDSTAGKPVVTKPPIVNNNKPVTDTTSGKPVIPPVVTPFVLAAGAPHYVALVLNKVDPVFSSEAKNAFFRYNRETFYNKQFVIDLITIDADNKLMLISPFKNAEEAMAYIDKTRPKTATEIIPWLKGGKYSFSIITDKNLDILKANQKMDNYKAFLDQHFPGRF
jgi:hypothetical protein